MNKSAEQRAGEMLEAGLLARKDFWGKGLVDTLVHLPLILPPVVTGYLLLLGFGRRGVFGAALAEIGIVFSFRWTGAALACAVMGFPLMVRAMRLSLEAVDRKLEQAAETLGASPAAVFVVVTLPLALPGILAGAVLLTASAALADSRVFIIANQPDGYGVDRCLANSEKCGASAAAAWGTSTSPTRSRTGSRSRRSGTARDGSPRRACAASRRAPTNSSILR